jgi:hypothetical protein
MLGVRDLFLVFLVGVGLVLFVPIALLLWVLSLWGDDETPLD